MTLTADEVYALIKHQEATFPIPAPYHTVDVGSLDITTGIFSGMRTESERDPEPLPHQPGQQPHNPPPRYIGSSWVSVTIDKTWHQTITTTPAPKVPLAPVLLRFTVTPASPAWTVTAAGRTFTAAAGQTELLADVWDNEIVNWTISVGAVTVQDTIRLQRPAGPPAAGIGAFTIPVLPLSLVYAPPVDEQHQSNASYTAGHTVGTSLDLGLSDSATSSVPVHAAGFDGQVSGFTGALRADALVLDKTGASDIAKGFNTVADQIGQVTATHQVEVSDGFDLTMTVTQSTTDTAATTAAGGGPGDGDVLHFYKDVRMAWAYFDGTLRLCPLDAVEVLTTVAGLRADPHGLAAADIAELLALDPFGTDAEAALLPGDRFQLLQHLEYSQGATLVRTITTARDTKTQSTHRKVTTDSQRWDAGPILTALGIGGATSKSLTLTNATGDDVTETVTITLQLVSGPNDHFVVDVYLDTLFGTFAIQPRTPAPTARIRGEGRTPGEIVLLEAGGTQFRTAVGPDGTFSFRAPGIPDGPITVSFE